MSTNLNNGCKTDEPNFFAVEMLDKHFAYTYDNGKYEFWVKNHERIVYAIHGGPMAGRRNYQTCTYQRIRENLWQIGWVEETGTVVTMALDIPMKRVTTYMVFSKGHWEFSEKAHGYKHTHLDQWRELSKVGNSTTDRHVLPEQANIDVISTGRGDLEDIEMEWPTL